MKALATLVLSSVLVLATVTMVLAEEQVKAPGVVAFSGSWVLDKQASDDVGKLMSRPQMSQQEGKGGSRGGSGRGSGRGGRRGGGMGGKSGGMGGGQGSQRQSGDFAADSAQKKLRLQKQISALAIFSDGHELDITDGLDMTRLLYCDGRQVSIWTERGEVQARAKWQNGQLVETWLGGKMPGRTLTYRLSEDGSRLSVMDQRSRPGGRGSVTLKLVYRRQETP